MKKRILVALAAALLAPAIAAAATGSVTVTSPESVGAKRNTLLSWTWRTSGDVSAVDIYLVAGSKWYSFAKAYPNYGNFSWAAGLTAGDWKMDEVESGDYSIAVCPAGARKGGSSCDSFALSIYGDTPAIKILSPKSGKTLRRGDEAKVSFSGGQEGDEYEVVLRNPFVKGGPDDTSIVTYVAPGDGKQTLSVTVPADVSAGKYTVAVIQKTDGGEACLNVCAQAESKVVRVR